MLVCLCESKYVCVALEDAVMNQELNGVCFLENSHGVCCCFVWFYSIFWYRSSDTLLSTVSRICKLVTLWFIILGNLFYNLGRLMSLSRPHHDVSEAQGGTRTSLAKLLTPQWQSLHCVYCFSFCTNRIPDKRNLRGEGHILAHSFLGSQSYTLNQTGPHIKACT